MDERPKTVRERAQDMYRAVVFTRADLLGDGMSPRSITQAVRIGSLRRLRRDRYAPPGIDEAVAEAVRIGGRLTCVSLLRAIGVFVLQNSGLHVHVRPGSSRIRRPKGDTTKLHWEVWSGWEAAMHATSLRDAVRHAVRCQTPRAAIATLDSILHHRLMTGAQLAEMFATLPERFHVLLALADPSAESGPETFMRLILRSLGVPFEAQVQIPGVGRVDFLVDGWLIIECDSREFHQGWDHQVHDRARDLAAAGLGHVTVRPLAADIMDREDQVRNQIAAVLAAFGRR